MKGKLWLWAALAFAGACTGDGKIDGIGEDTLVHGTRVHPMPMRNRLINTPPPDPSFVYYGGPLVGNAKIVEVLWGGDVEHATELGRFYAAIADSEYFDLLAEYGTPQRPIGRGSFAGLVTHPNPPSGDVVDDKAIQVELARLLYRKVLPENDDDTIYAVHFPPGITITHGGAASCDAFCAYHGTFQRNGKLVPYIVVPDLGGACSVGCGMADKLSNTTWVASHELAQAVTNPAIGFAAKDPAAPLAWYDPKVGEISDACAGSAQIGGFVVQTQWSIDDDRCRFGSSTSSTFTIGVSPPAQTVRAGTSATVVVMSTATAPGAPMISLDATGLPDGVTASFEPAAVLAGKSAVLTLEAAADAPSALATITVTGRAGMDTQSTTAKLTVDSPRPGNDFSLEVTPVSQTVRRGGEVKLTARTAVTSGDAEPIMLTISGLPDGVTAVFAPQIIGAGASSELTLTAGPTAAVGSVLLVITAAARAATHTAAVSLDVEDVPPVNDFAVAIEPGSRTVTGGTSETFLVSTETSSGGPQSVTLTASGLPPGVIYSFDPVTVTSGSSSTMTVTAAADAGAATAPFTVTGTAASGTRTTTATLTVEPAPPVNDFSVAVTPPSRSLAPGEMTTYDVTTAVTSGNAVMIAFAISGLPAGVTAVFEPSSVMAGEGATLRVSAGPDAAALTAPLTVTGASATASHAAEVQLTVTAPPPSEFELAVAPPTQSVTAGESATFVVTTTATSGRPELVTLSASSLADGVSARFTPAEVLAGGTATLELTAAEDAPPGSDGFLVRGTSPSMVRTSGATLIVSSLPPPSDFSLAVSPDARQVLPGQTVTYTISTQTTSGAAQSVALAVTGLPAGVTGGIVPSTVTSGGSATLTLSASPTAPAGLKTFTVSGTAASGARLDTAELEVLPPPITNLIENGDFETGDLAGWLVDEGVALNVENAHHGGAHSARIGSSSLYVYDSAMYQLVDVPAFQTTSLTWWAYPRCPDFWGSQQAYLLDEEGYILRTVYDDCDDSAAWEKITVDLSPYAGTQVYLYLRVRDYGFALTWMYIDDVQAVSQ